jgi:anti-sigma factor RsiW
MGKLLYRARFVWDHRWTPGRMSAYVDGELGSRRRLRLERHVGECEECRLILAGLREMLEALHRLPALSGTGEPSRIAAAVRLRLREPPARD